jgi:hypothetical protein
MTSKKTERGFWEYSFFQKTNKEINEQDIKSKCPTGNFDHYKIHKMMYPSENKEDILLQKYNNGEKLKSNEQLIVQNIIEKEEKQRESDNEKINKFGLNAKNITTDEGRIRLLLIVAQNKLKEEDYEMVYYVHMKLSEFNIPQNIKENNLTLFDNINNAIKKVNKIKLQFTKFHSNMPPLNQKGFNSLDPFQKQVIYNIDHNISCIVQAPTSSGKSILTGYLYTKKNMKAIIVVPTDILAWQMASMVGKINGKDIPLVTQTYQSSPKRDELIDRINNVGIVVGTPTFLLDILPLVNVTFDWLVIDEIHMIGKNKCSEMETIAKVYNDTKVLALSATIGNVEYLQEWFKTIGYNNIDVVKCNKRFFNLQRFYYQDGKLNRITPLSMVNVNDFVSDVDEPLILKKNLCPTPPDVWDLVEKLDLEEDDENEYYYKGTRIDLDPYVYFEDKRITLDMCNEYYNHLIRYMCDTMEDEDIEDILNSSNKVKNVQYNLVDVAFTLKHSNKTPAIIFNTDTWKCLEMVKHFSKNVIERENTKYPNLYKKRLKLQSKAKQMEKKADKLKLDDMTEKQQSKALMSGKMDEFTVSQISLNEPHKDFIFNKHQKISQYNIDKWYDILKKYFPMNGIEYHYIIDLLWRGVGIYVKGLPDPYLRIIQNMACDGDLAIVFSDDSLVFGVSMPFRTTVITNDNIDSMMYHQMSGRAGRRGLDKEGNVVFVNNSWERIKELSTSTIPQVDGYDTMTYGYLFSTKINNNNRWLLSSKHYLHKDINDEYVNYYYSIVKKNMENGWGFINSNDINLNIMMWKLRHSEDCYRIPFLIEEIKNKYKNCNPNSEQTQIEFAHFMLSFTNIITTFDDNILTCIDENIKLKLIKLEIEVPDNICNRLYSCIKENRLVNNTENNNSVRENLIKFAENLKHVQHYFYHNKDIQIARLVGKLLTRIWWIYHSSSPLMV